MVTSTSTWTYSRANLRPLAHSRLLHLRLGEASFGLHSNSREVIRSCESRGTRPFASLWGLDEVRSSGNTSAVGGNLHRKVDFFFIDTMQRHWTSTKKMHLRMMLCLCVCLSPSMSILSVCVCVCVSVTIYVYFRTLSIQKSLLCMIVICDRVIYRDKSCQILVTLPSFFQEIQLMSMLQGCKLTCVSWYL